MCRIVINNQTNKFWNTNTVTK